VVLVRLPRDKARPARCSPLEPALRAFLRDGAALTADLRANASLRIDIAPGEGSELLAPSQVMVDWPQTVRFSDMGDAIGSLDTATMRAITRQMAVVLGIGSDTSRSRRTRTR